MVLLHSPGTVFFTPRPVCMTTSFGQTALGKQLSVHREPRMRMLYAVCVCVTSCPLYKLYKMSFLVQWLHKRIYKISFHFPNQAFKRKESERGPPAWHVLVNSISSAVTLTQDSQMLGLLQSLPLQNQHDFQSISSAADTSRNIGLGQEFSRAQRIRMRVNKKSRIFKI